MKTLISKFFNRGVFTIWIINILAIHQGLSFAATNDSDNMIETNLDIALTGIVLNEDNYLAILRIGKGEERAYFIGESIMEDVYLYNIKQKYILITVKGRNERLLFRQSKSTGNEYISGASAGKNNGENYISDLNAAHYLQELNIQMTLPITETDINSLSEYTSSTSVEKNNGENYISDLNAAHYLQELNIQMTLPITETDINSLSEYTSSTSVEKNKGENYTSNLNAAPYSQESNAQKTMPITD